MNAVHFPNVSTGYAVGGNGLILKTVNGGNNWVALTSGTTSILYSVFFTDADTGHAVGTSGTVLKTTDGGITWSSQKLSTTGRLTSVHFPTPTIGYIACRDGLPPVISGRGIFLPRSAGQKNVVI